MLAADGPVGQAASARQVRQAGRRRASRQTGRQAGSGRSGQTGDQDVKKVNLLRRLTSSRPDGQTGQMLKVVLTLGICNGSLPLPACKLLAWQTRSCRACARVMLPVCQCPSPQRQRSLGPLSQSRCFKWRCNAIITGEQVASQARQARQAGGEQAASARQVRQASASMGGCEF